MNLNLRKKEDCMFDMISLGEIMLRLDPGEGRIKTARSFRAWEGGGEYNVARGLRRCFGMKTAVVTAFADNEVGRLLEDFIMQGGVDTSLIKWVKYDGIGRTVRNGLNFTERGFGIRGAVGVSDRGNTAISQLKAGDIDWDYIFGTLGVRWLHTGGIFAALSESTAEVVVEAVKKGEKLPIKTNKILTNYINKMDYASFMVPLTQIQQICADMIHCHANELLAENDSTLVVEDIELALNTLYEHDQNRVAARQQLAVLEARLTEKELSKYQQILRADTTKEAILALAEERLHVADSIFEKIAEEFYLTINKTITPFEKYRDALNDIIIFAHQLPQGEAEIVNMLPLSEGYLVVYADGLFYVVNSQLEIIRQFEHKQHVPIKAVYKIAGDKIAVISPTYTFFIDNQGTAK